MRSSAPTPLNQFQLLRTRRFMPFFVTQFLGALNDNLFKNAMVLLLTFQEAHLNAQFGDAGQPGGQGYLSCLSSYSLRPPASLPTSTSALASSG